LYHREKLYIVFSTLVQLEHFLRKYVPMWLQPNFCVRVAGISVTLILTSMNRCSSSLSWGVTHMEEHFGSESAATHYGRSLFCYLNPPVLFLSPAWMMYLTTQPHQSVFNLAPNICFRWLFYWSKVNL